MRSMLSAALVILAGVLLAPGRAAACPPNPACGVPHVFLVCCCPKPCPVIDIPKNLQLAMQLNDVRTKFQHTIGIFKSVQDMFNMVKNVRLMMNIRSLANIGQGAEDVLTTLRAEIDAFSVEGERPNLNVSGYQDVQDMVSRVRQQQTNVGERQGDLSRLSFARPIEGMNFSEIGRTRAASAAARREMIANYYSAATAMLAESEQLSQEIQEATEHADTATGSDQNAAQDFAHRVSAELMVGTYLIKLHEALALRMMMNAVLAEKAQQERLVQ